MLCRSLMKAIEDLVSSMTLADLSKRSGKSVGDIVAHALAPTSSAPVRSQGKAHTHAQGTPDVRTPSGRAAYRAAVLNAVRSHDGPIAAVDVRTQVGGTPQQVRTALNSLIEEGEIQFKGKARATRYY